MRPKPVSYILMGRRLFACLLLCIYSHVAPAAQDNEEERLSELENILNVKRQEKKALELASQQAETDAEKIARELVVTANDIQQTEANSARLEVRIGSLESEVKLKEDTLGTRQNELLTLIAALERLSKRPAAMALLQPGEALDTARSASLMGTLVPQISSKAEELRTDLSILASIKAKLSSERFNLKNSLEELTGHKLKLASLLARRRSEANEASEGAKRASIEIDAITREAKSLRELLSKLAAHAKRTKPTDVIENKGVFKPDSRPMTDMKGLLSLPVIGSIIQKFGQKIAIGTAKGIRISARAGAQVVSPYDGKVVFAGPFRDYGNLVILEHEGGYHSLLAGMKGLYNRVGQWVLSGEPIGLMGESKTDDGLYLEIRKKGTPINPEPWLERNFAMKQTAQ